MSISIKEDERGHKPMASQNPPSKTQCVHVVIPYEHSRTLTRGGLAMRSLEALSVAATPCARRRRSECPDNPTGAKIPEAQRKKILCGKVANVQIRCLF